MGDEELRALERRWHETADVEDEVALLRARLRVGLVPSDQLGFATACGVASARELVGGGPGVKELERARLLRATLLHRFWLLLLPLLGANEQDLGAREELTPMLDGLEDWARCPCEAHRQAFEALPAPKRGWSAYPVVWLDEDVRQLVRGIWTLEDDRPLDIFEHSRGTFEKLARYSPVLTGLADTELDLALAARARAWCLGQPVPDLRALADAHLDLVTTQQLEVFRERFAHEVSIHFLEHPSLQGHPSLWAPDSDVRVVPVVIPGVGQKTRFVDQYRGALRRAPADQLLTKLLPSWGEEGLRVVPLTGIGAWVEVDPARLSRLLETPPPATPAQAPPKAKRTRAPRPPKSAPATPTARRSRRGTTGSDATGGA